jgi:hypothetical protein
LAGAPGLSGLSGLSGIQTQQNVDALIDEPMDDVDFVAD